MNKFRLALIALIVALLLMVVVMVVIQKQNAPEPGWVETQLQEGQDNIATAYYLDLTATAEAE